jgi:adenine-specific DNA-methyltransferase
VYAELKKYNELFIEKIDNAWNKKEIKAVLEDILKNGFISYSIDKIALKECDAEFFDLDLINQKKCLRSLLDMNFLYVPFSEIADKTYGFPAHEIKLNKEFYSLKIK